MMKKSSMHTAPKGKTPPRAIANAGLVYHIWSGTCLYANRIKQPAPRQSTTRQAALSAGCQCYRKRKVEPSPNHWWTPLTSCYDFRPRNMGCVFRSLALHGVQLYGLDTARWQVGRHGRGTTPTAFKGCCGQSTQHESGPCTTSSQSPGDLVDPDGNGVSLRTETKVAPHKHQRRADKEPQEQQRHRQLR